MLRRATWRATARPPPRPCRRCPSWWASCWRCLPPRRTWCPPPREPGSAPRPRHEVWSPTAGAFEASAVSLPPTCRPAPATVSCNTPTSIQRSRPQLTFFPPAPAPRFSLHHHFCTGAAAKALGPLCLPPDAVLPPLAALSNRTVIGMLAAPSCPPPDCVAQSRIMRVLSRLHPRGHQRRGGSAGGGAVCHLGAARGESGGGEREQGAGCRGRVRGGRAKGAEGWREGYVWDTAGNCVAGGA